MARNRRAPCCNTRGAESRWERRRKKVVYRVIHGNPMVIAEKCVKTLSMARPPPLFPFSHKKTFPRPPPPPFGLLAKKNDLKKVGAGGGAVRGRPRGCPVQAAGHAPCHE